MTHLHEISSSHYGRRVLLYLLVPRSSRHFSSQFVQVLAVGDSNTHSKKPAEVRRQELLESVAPALVTLATEQLEEWLQSKTHSPLFLEVMLCSHGDQLSLYQRMMTVLCDEGGVALLSDVHTDWVMGRLLVRDNRKEGETFVGDSKELVGERDYQGCTSSSWCGTCGRTCATIVAHAMHTYCGWN